MLRSLFFVQEVAHTWCRSNFKGMARWRKKKSKTAKTDSMTSKLRFTWKVASLERLAFPDRHLADPAVGQFFSVQALILESEPWGSYEMLKQQNPKKNPPKSLDGSHENNIRTGRIGQTILVWSLMTLDGTSHWNCVKDDLEATYYIPLINGQWSYLCG